MKPLTLLSMNAPIVFGGNLLAPLYALFAQQVGASAFIISSLVALPIIIGGLIGYAVSLFITPDTALRILRWSYLVRSLGFVLFFVPSMPVLFTIQALMGIAHGIGTPSFFVLFSGNDSMRWGQRELVNAGVTSSAMFIGGVIVTLFTWNVLFACMTLLPLLSFVISYRTGKD